MMTELGGLFLPPNYRARIAQFGHSDQDIGQSPPDVLPFAKRIARSFGQERILVITAASANEIASMWLASGDRESRTSDALLDVEQVPGGWRIHSMENPAAREELRRQLTASLLVCVDLFERTESPDTILTLLAESMWSMMGVLAVTPDRDRSNGEGDGGPPVSLRRAREWSSQEFTELLRSYGISPLLRGHTRTSADSEARCHWVAFALGGYANAKPSKTATLLALVPCYNESDVITTTVERLLGQGACVHVIDNWSNDGSWELLSRNYGDDPRVSQERFPNTPTSEYAWAAILEEMEAVAIRSTFDWIMHVDADEQFDVPGGAMNLVDFLSVMEAAGFDAVDSTRIDFRPDFARGESVFGLPDQFEFITNDGAGALHRAWKNRHARMGIAETGGHRIVRPVRMAPFNLILRHFPLRSLAQANRKIFRDRLPRFGSERSLGWHVQYDQYAAGDKQFDWSDRRLYRWHDRVTEEFVIEFASRIGL